MHKQIMLWGVILAAMVVVYLKATHNRTAEFLNQTGEVELFNKISVLAV